MVTKKQRMDKFSKWFEEKYLKEKEASPPSTSGGLKGETPLSPLPVYKIPFIPIKPKEASPPSTSRDRTYGSINSLQKKPQMASSGEGERKPSVSSGDLIAIGIIVSMIALPFLLLADWESIIQRIRSYFKGNKNTSTYSTFNPFEGR